MSTAFSILAPVLFAFLIFAGIAHFVSTATAHLAR